MCNRLIVISARVMQADETQKQLEKTERSVEELKSKLTKEEAKRREAEVKASVKTPAVTTATSASSKFKKVRNSQKLHVYII